MIFDVLSECERYYPVNKSFAKAFDFIKKAEAENLAAGKYEFEDFYAMVQEYATKKPEDAKFEGHRKYIDIQYIVSGKETVKVADIAKMEVSEIYDENKDVEFFKDVDNCINTVLEAGQYGIFFPNDIHKPGMFAGENPSEVKKIVVKIKVD